MSKATCLLTLDWLEVALTGKLHELSDVRILRDGYDGIALNGDIELIRIPKGGYVTYKYAFLIRYKSKEFGVLYYGNTVTIDKVQLKVNNNILYSAGYIRELKKIIKLLGLNFTHYHRIDIALDGVGFIGKVDKLLRSNLYDFVSDVKPRNAPDLKTKKWTSLLLGSVAGKKIISIYNKTKEIHDQATKGEINKQYILDYCRANDLNAEQIERVELRLFSTKLKQFGKNLDWLKDTGFLFKIFKGESEGWLQFKNKETKKYRGVINWNLLKMKSKIKPVIVDDALSDHVVLMKQALKALLIDYRKSFDNPLLDVSIIIARHYGLIDWVQVNLKKWRYLSRKADQISVKKARKEYYRSKLYLNSIRKKKPS